MDDATSLLSATCDTFIKTLEECMKLCNANILYELPHHNEVTLPPVHRVPATRKVTKPDRKIKPIVVLIFTVCFRFPNP